MTTGTSFPGHISVLRQEFEAQASRNAGYSLRAFSADDITEANETIRAFQQLKTIGAF